MYLGHFGLRELPFGITPDTQFVYSGIAHQGALNTLLIAHQTGEGFIKVTGEVGTGKTLLCRRFLATLNQRTVAAYIPNPQMEPRALLSAVAEEIGASPGNDAAFLIKSINRRLLELAAEGRTALVCLDEAQTIPALTLESLRLLSNLETEKRKLLQIVLFGQPELDEHLNTRASRQLLQRIAFHHKIPPLQKGELSAYLGHRLGVAGYRGPPIFTPGAVRALFLHSGGIPRLVNILAHKAMLAAFGSGAQRIDKAMIHRAAADTPGARSVSWWQRVF